MSNSQQVQSTTIDPKETELFSSLTATWWNEKNGPLKILHRMNDLVLIFIKKNLLEHNLVEKEAAPSYFKGLKVLDVGCGGGILSERLVKLGFTVTAIDINADVIAVAKEHAKRDPALTNLTYDLETIEKHAINNTEKYDVVINNFVLSHIQDHELFLNSCMKCLKPGGYLFCSALSQTYTAWFMLKLFENIIGLLPKRSHQWKNLIKQEKTQEILEKNNYKTENSQGYLHNIFTGRCIPLKRASFFYILFAIKSKRVIGKL